MTDDNRNMILAIILSAFVLIGWSLLGPKVLPTATPQTVQVRDGKAIPTAQPPAGPGGAPATGAASLGALGVRSDVIASTPRIKVDTPSLFGSINLKGARIDDLRLVRQRETIDAKSAPVRLFSPAGAPGAYFAGAGWTADGIAVPGPDTVWQASSRLLQPGKPVTLSWTNPTGQRFEQVIAVDDSYLFTIQQRVVNGAATRVTVRPYGFASRANQSHDPSTWTAHVGPISVIDGKANYSTKWETLNEAGAAGTTGEGGTGWVGFTDKYWLAALAPSGEVTPGFRRTPTGGYQADYAAAPEQIAPGQAATTQVRLFAGAKEKAALDRYEDEGIAKLSKSIDWGWFEWFMRPLFNLLRWLFAMTGNFGVAIILLTCVVRAIMFPIANRQFKSTLAMRRVQPKLKALQARWKDDKPRQQQEMMKLYKEEKVNPAAGCLPIFLQIPVFYALYKVLMVSVEMRHQPFFLWVKDLSAPDPLTPVNLFGFLHFSPPALLAIGVLPILVGFTQWLTIKMNPMVGVDPTQQQIMTLMPWFMIFVFAPFAAGLQLYYVMNNLLTLAQQTWFNKMHPVEASTAIVDAKPAKR
ncbi:membrane protein insertase YidC [Sphingomonas sp.]|uniref:membrane protein insertase YidC n=1 Tax=Sphingomonas sp. TaxID=28214 RepID=UPI00286A8999|nr:membrane protein insertase YidC [Sphingomonas sp.]